MSMCLPDISAPPQATCSEAFRDSVSQCRSGRSDFYHYSVLSLSPRAVRDGTRISNARAGLKDLLSVQLASKWPTRDATRDRLGLELINRHGARDG